MKEHIIRAILYQDTSVKWKDAALNGTVNIHLNVHQKARQFVEVELGDFILNDGEEMLAAFERTVDGETHHVNPDLMTKIEDENNAYRLQIPSLVHNTPGEWNVTFYVATDYNKATGEYTYAHPSDAAKFSEYSSFLDDGLTVPSAENLKALYDESKTAKNDAQTYAENASQSADTASKTKTEIDGLLETAKEYVNDAEKYATNASGSADTASKTVDEAITSINAIAVKMKIFLYYDDEGYPCWGDAETENEE